MWKWHELPLPPMLNVLWKLNETVYAVCPALFLEYRKCPIYRCCYEGDDACGHYYYHHYECYSSTHFPLVLPFLLPEPKKTALFSLHLWANLSISNSLLLQLLLTCLTGLKDLEVLSTCEGTQHFYFLSSCWIEFLMSTPLPPPAILFE